MTRSIQNTPWDVLSHMQHVYITLGTNYLHMYNTMPKNNNNDLQEYV